MIASPVSLATTGLTTGMAARPFLIGSAGVVFRENPVIPFLTGISGGAQDTLIQSQDQMFNAELLAHITPGVPQRLGDFVKLFASTDAEHGIEFYIEGASPFDALESAWDERGLGTATSRMIHSFWVYRGLKALQRDTHEALARFEERNPGRGAGTILGQLARATHSSWLAGESQAAHFVPYSQDVHDAIERGIMLGFIPSTDIGLHQNPKKKFKLKADALDIPSTPEGKAFIRHLEGVIGRSMGSAFSINTVSGTWDDLLAIRVAGNPEWAALRPAFLFGLQSDNVAAVLKGLEDKAILTSLSTGTIADKLQSLVELLRVINTAWRINNPWGWKNSPLIRTPFALEEDGGIGIGDIMKDAITLRATLDALEAARKEGRVSLEPEIAAGLRLAYKNGLSEVLDVMLDEAALEAAVRSNTMMYNEEEAG